MGVVLEETRTKDENQSNNVKLRMAPPATENAPCMSFVASSWQLITASSY
jgi:hypothetical protein